MRFATPVDELGNSAHSWGRAHWMAVGEAVDGEITSWEVIEVAWDIAHDTGTGAQHHARIARFLKQHGVEAAVLSHVGDGMSKMMDTMKITKLEALPGDAKASVLAAVSAG